MIGVVIGLVCASMLSCAALLYILFINSGRLSRLEEERERIGLFESDTETD